MRQTERYLSNDSLGPSVQCHVHISPLMTAAPAVTLELTTDTLSMIKKHHQEVKWNDHFLLLKCF